MTTSFEICAERDTMGLYEMSRIGKVIDFTGVSSPFEVPENPDLVIDTDNVPVAENVVKIYEAILPFLRI